MEEMEKGSREEHITIEDVKACNGWENLSDEEAQRIVDVVRAMAQIAYSIYQRNKAISSSCKKSGKIIYLSGNQPDIKDKKAA